MLGYFLQDHKHIIMDQFLGEIRSFAGSFAPKGWVLCDGRSLAVSQYQALYALIGNTYGGSGASFNVPDLMGRVAIGEGTGPGLTPRVLADRGGRETETITEGSMPAHHHMFKISESPGVQKTTNENFLGKIVTPANQAALGYLPAGANVNPNKLNQMTILSAGGSQAHNNMMPTLAMTFIIATEGLFPQRP